MSTPTMTRQERVTDPGFTEAMDANEAAIAELRTLGVSYDAAMAIVNRAYRTGVDRGLALGLRMPR